MGAGSQITTVMAVPLNKLASLVSRIHAGLPASFHPLAVTLAFDSQVYRDSLAGVYRFYLGIFRRNRRDSGGESRSVELNSCLQVKMAGAAGILIDKLSVDEAILRLRNRRRVQNHIGGIHAAATALLAESATGAVFAMNVRQTDFFSSPQYAVCTFPHSPPVCCY
jgi:hypothetical protein